MSQLAVVEHYWTEPNCDYHVTFLTQYLVLLYGAHAFIALGVFLAALLRTKELYLLLLTLGIGLNFYLNGLLLWAFDSAVPQPLCGVLAIFCVDRASPYNACGVPPFPSPPPAGATCGALPLPSCDPCVPCGMPAIEPHLSGFAIVSIGVFAMQWRSPHIRLYQTTLLVLFYALVVYTHVYIGFNDAAQVLGGAFAGAVAGVFWQFVVFWAAYPNFDRMLRWPVIRTFGYGDTYCRSYRTVPGDPQPLQVDAAYLRWLVDDEQHEAYPADDELLELLRYEEFIAAQSASPSNVDAGFAAAKQSASTLVAVAVEALTMA